MDPSFFIILVGDQCITISIRFAPVARSQPLLVVSSNPPSLRSMETVSQNFISYSLNQNLDCNKICKDIQALIIKNSPDSNSVLVIKIQTTKLGGDNLILKLPCIM